MGAARAVTSPEVAELVGCVAYRGDMDVLEPVVQPYAWGSRRIIADLLGRPAPSDAPEAELWMGAHPAAPAGLTRAGERTTLDRVVEQAPERELGAVVSERFEGRLPFLLKVLAAEKALSIQVHPDRDTARAAFAAQRERGVEPGDPEATYADDWPKPEIVCALTPFEALAGMREAGEAAGLLRALGVEALAPVVERLDEGDDAGLVEALRTLLAWPQDARGDLLTRVVEAADELAESDGEHAGAYRAVVRAAADHPGDLGAVATLLLNHTILQPGEGLYLAAGGLHAYLRGAGVEILANSDNVLRACSPASGSTSRSCAASSIRPSACRSCARSPTTTGCRPTSRPCRSSASTASTAPAAASCCPARGRGSCSTSPGSRGSTLPGATGPMRRSSSRAAGRLTSAPPTGP